MLISIILSLSVHKELPKFQELTTIAISSIGAIGLVEAIQIPCIYRYGAEKGRIQLFIFMVIIALLLGGIVFMGEKMNILFLASDWITSYINSLPILLVIMTIVIYVISYKIAYRIYCKKEL